MSSPPALSGKRLPDDIDPDWQRCGRGSFARLCRFVLHSLRWRLVMKIPHVDRAVIVFYPHTSNWDFVIGLLARFALGISVTWAGKDNLFRWPFASLWTALGGIPVNRRERTGFVAQMTSAFDRRSRMLLAIAPEGTRQRTTHWKSGFYRVALAARVPIALAFIDFPRREVGVGALLQPIGDPEADFAALRAFYDSKTGRHPSQASPILLAPVPFTSTAAPAAPAESPSHGP